MIKTIKSGFKKYFVTGFLVIVPIGASFSLLRYLFLKADSFVDLLPKNFRPVEVIGYDIPGLGIIVVVLVITLVGFLARIYLVSYFIKLGERIIKKIPLISMIYSAIQQLLESILTKRHDQFSKVVLIEYPRKGLYSVGFVTSTSGGEIQQKTTQKTLNLFLPTTPNPTSGFYLMIPEEDAVELDMTVEEAFKLIISGGIVEPDAHREKSVREN